MDRRRFLECAGLGVAGMAAGCRALGPPLPRSRPNVVLIYADDLGWGDVGYHGVADILTPNIDRLAREGTWFSQGYVSASVCGPSRAGLMTGVYQQRFGCGENPNTRGFPDDPRFPLLGVPSWQPMLQERLKAVGYRTGMVGKWHLGLHETLRPNARGFDCYYGFLNGAHDYEKASADFRVKKNLWPLFRNGDMEPPYAGYLTDTFSDEAVRFIEREHAAPFFLYVAYNAVHSPWQVPAHYVERVRHLTDSEDRAIFAGMVLAMDDGIGRILAALETAGVADNTLVAFISDNGTPRGQGLQPGRKDLAKARGGCTMSNPGPFRGFKGDTYEGGIRVPYILRWPGRIPAGERCDLPVSSLDIAPTVLSQVGVIESGGRYPFDGVDMMPYLSGKRGEARPHQVLFWRRDNDYAIRQGDWKLCWNDAGGSPTIKLFNLAKDPGEYRDVAGLFPERAQALQDRFDAWDNTLPDHEAWGGPWNRKRHRDPDFSVARFNARADKGNVRRKIRP